ncbi:LOW QUALITY PROTEIN: TNF receptor-associated factor 1-like [Erpetoichthys calabaricus]|uniref:LOW QUALITY PROTEIN: TNF receptor-associated factor 1-like n=1 Tax=Erpetoichthys calabaricus TaxID=27687 RepID=UPI00223417D7|nr:LOW QUALITY PROTEIN: TNF receptor-associated factor 1-like [Erpetoichthys calabaricus]
MAEVTSGCLEDGLSSTPDENEYPSGFPPNICDDAPQAKYLCSNCSNILNKAHQTLCGHRYCLACLSWLMRNNNSPVCKKCKEENPGAVAEESILTADHFYNDAAINKEISDLSVHCANQGCNWKNTLKNYEDHQSQCDYALIPCNIGCGQMVIRKKLASHLEKGCVNNILVCSKCSQKMSPSEFQKHSCEKAQVKEKKPAKEKNRPLMTAKNKDQCRFCEVGCTFKGNKEKTKEHEHTSLVPHLQLLLQAFYSVKSSLFASQAGANGDDGHFVDVQHKLNQLESTFDCLNMRTTPEMNGDLEVDSNLHSSNSDGAQNQDDLNRCQVKLEELAQKIQVYENIVTVLNREVEKSQMTIAAYENQNKTDQDTIKKLEAEVSELQSLLPMKDLLINALHVRTAALEEISYDGTFIWKISELNRKMQEAASGRVSNQYSPAFYTGKYGYKVCMRLYLNGDGAGKGKFMSLFFVIMRGDYDALISWPFKHKVTFFLMDQNHREHVIDAFRPDLKSSSFQRPLKEMNVASGCPLFFPLSKLSSPKHAYCKDDTVFIIVLFDLTS